MNDGINDCYRPLDCCDCCPMLDSCLEESEQVEIEMQVESLIAQSRSERALEVIQKFQIIADSDTLNFYKAQILIEQDKMSEAEGVIENSLKKYPNSNKLQTLKIHIGL